MSLFDFYHLSCYCVRPFPLCLYFFFDMKIKISMCVPQLVVRNTQPVPD